MVKTISTPFDFDTIEERNAEVLRLLKEFYPNCEERIPQQRQKAQWQPENNLGFFTGIVQFGIDDHVEELLKLLQSNGFQEQQLFSMQLEPTFIDRMFDWYIMPFHKSYNWNSSHTPLKGLSRSNSGQTSVKEEEDQDYQSKEFSHKNLKEAVEKRDEVCLFCWDMLECEGAHIIAQKNMLHDESSLLKRAGLEQKHQVQNSLLLCLNCHSQFGKLKRYVDFIDDKLVIKVVNETNDTESDKHKDWEIATDFLQSIRRTGQKYLLDGRTAVESNGEMALYFVQNNATKLPNRQALEFHKISCLIWRMAGGAEPDEEYCSDDEQGPVNTAELRKRFKLPPQDSGQL